MAWHTISRHFSGPSALWVGGIVVVGAVGVWVVRKGLGSRNRSLDEDKPTHENHFFGFEPEKEGVFTLRDGRRLSFAEYGDPNGFPVVYLHQGLASRISRPPNDDLTTQLGIRLIVPERPGYGNSDLPPQGEKHTLTDIALDIAELAEHLDLNKDSKKFSIIGASAGAAPSLACAIKLGPKQLHFVGIVGSIHPFDSALLKRFGNRWNFRLLIWTVRHSPWLARFFYTLAAKPGLSSDQLLKYAFETDVDRQVFSQPLIMGMYRTAREEAVKNGYDGLRLDLERGLDWNGHVDLRGLEMEVTVWQGLKDEMTKPAAATWMQSQNPRMIKVVEVPGEGHYFHFQDKYWEQIGRAAVPRKEQAFEEDEEATANAPECTELAVA